MHPAGDSEPEHPMTPVGTLLAARNRAARHLPDLLEQQGILLTGMLQRTLARHRLRRVHPEDVPKSTLGSRQSQSNG